MKKFMPIFTAVFCIAFFELPAFAFWSIGFPGPSVIVHIDSDVFTGGGNSGRQNPYGGKQDESGGLKKSTQEEADALASELKEKAEQGKLDDFAKKVQETSTDGGVKITVENSEKLWQLKWTQHSGDLCLRSEDLSVNYSTGKCKCVIKLPLKRIEAIAEADFDVLLALMRRYKVKQ